MIFTPLKKSSLQWCWLGRVDYRQSLEIQLELEAQRRAGKIPDTLLLLEHPHTYTLGRSASRDDILISRATCKQVGVEVFESDRGGQVTYHGPGQLVGYLIMELRARRLSVPQFVWHIEEAIQRTLGKLDLKVERQEKRPGLWYQGRKLASVGFHISRGITRHGFSINWDPNLRYFDWIIPCGSRGPISSLAQELGQTIPLRDLVRLVTQELDQVFSMSSLDELSPTSNSWDSVST